jgi:hypothetical protein
MTDDTLESTVIISCSSGDSRVDKAPGFEGYDSENDTTAGDSSHLVMPPASL